MRAEGWPDAYGPAQALGRFKENQAIGTKRQAMTTPCARGEPLRHIRAPCNDSFVLGSCDLQSQQGRRAPFGDLKAHQRQHEALLLRNDIWRGTLLPNPFSPLARAQKACFKTNASIQNSKHDFTLPRARGILPRPFFPILDTI